MNKTFKKLTSFALAFAMMLAAAPTVFAANVSVASDNMTRQKASTVAEPIVSDHVITFTPLADSAGPTTVTFPSGFDVAGATGGAVAGQIVTVTGPVTAGTPVSFTIANVVNPTTPGNQVISISTGVDTGEITVPIIADDQIQITARVNQILFFDVRDGLTGATDNTVGFGDLDASTVRYATDDASGTTTEGASSQLEAGTNAAGGYIIDVTGETLTSMDALATPIAGLFTADAAPAAGTEAFGLQVAKTVASTGTDQGVVAGDYLGTYHLPDTGATDLLATNPGPSSNETYDVNYVANVSSFTPAGNYTTVMTYTMTATF